MMKLVTHTPCGTAIELRHAPHHDDGTRCAPWCPRCNRFVDLHTLSSTGPFSAVVRGEAPVHLRTGAPDDRPTPVR